MARRSKPSEPTEKKDKSEDISAEDNAEALSEDESVDDAPVVIEAEAVEVVEETTEETETTSEPVDAEIAPVPAPPRERSGFLPMVLGGVIAAGIGFAAGLFAPTYFSDTSREDALSAGVAGNGERIEALAADLSNVQGSIPEPVDISGLESGLSDINGRLGALDGRLTGIDETVAGLAALNDEIATIGDRLTALEIKDGNSASAQAAEAEAQLQNFKTTVEQMVSEAEARIAAAETRAAEKERAAAEAAALADRQAALSNLRVAIDSGAPFADMLAGMEDVPTSLSEVASDGVPTLVSLQRSFPDVARQALASSQKIPEDASAGQRFTAFLKQQTNARSLTPRDGSDADAILSRAESNLSQGNLRQAIDELSALPEEAQSVMSDWLSRAETRSTALIAVEQLSANMN